MAKATRKVKVMGRSRVDSMGQVRINGQAQEEVGAFGNPAYIVLRNRYLCYRRIMNLHEASLVAIQCNM